MTDTDTPARVFRVRRAVAYSSQGCGGDWKLYESVVAMKRDLLAAYLDVISDTEKRGERDERHWFARMWRAHLRGDQETYPRTRRIVAVEQLVDGAWVEITPEFIDPAVSLSGVR